VTFGREKRLLLGVLAFLAPLPLPYNEPRPEGVVGWPFLLVYLAAVAWFNWQVLRDRQRWLKPWMLNVLGLLYIPFFLFDLSTFWRGHLVRPMMHLVMFAMAAKLFSLHRERDKWQAFVGIFFLFLASMATSAHPGIVVYLAVFSSLLLATLVRFASYHVCGVFPAAEGTTMPSLGSFFAVTTLLTLILSVPLFLVLPRVRTPYVLGRGLSGTQVGYSTGFTDEVSLDVIGNIRSSREVALRVKPDAGEMTTNELRFRGATYDEYEGQRWFRSPLGEILRPDSRRRFVLAPGSVVEHMQIWLRPLNANSLILPVQAMELEIPVRTLGRSTGGALSLRGVPGEVLEYRVGVGRQPVYLGSPPSGEEDPTLSQAGVSEAIAELATEVAGEGTAAERARRIESHLISSYEYTLDLVGRRATSPIDDFLFKYRSGHCEYFASAMILMLRSQGIPARFVTGFLGGEYNPLEGYFIVRQSNAHAWVEAYLPEQGWQAYDPTPPSGRPGDQGSSWRILLQQAYDYILFRWDRYVLSYGFEDQLDIVSRLRRFLRELWERVRYEQGSGGVDASRGAADPTPGAATTSSSFGWLPAHPAFVFLGLALAVMALAGWWLRRKPSSATVAYRRLRRRAARRGVKLNPAVGPIALRDRLERRFPDAGSDARELIALYLRESFAGEELGEDECRAAEELLQRATRSLRKAS